MRFAFRYSLLGEERWSLLRQTISFLCRYRLLRGIHPSESLCEEWHRYGQDEDWHGPHIEHLDDYRELGIVGPLLSLLMAALTTHTLAAFSIPANSHTNFQLVLIHDLVLLA